MPRSVRIITGLLLAVVAGVSVFIVVLIATGVGPGWPRLPKQTTATVLEINREAVSVQASRDIDILRPFAGLTSTAACMNNERHGAEAVRIWCLGVR
jgi:hypothetical protein